MKTVRKDKDKIIKSFGICKKTCENWRKEYLAITFIDGRLSKENFIRKCLVVWGNSIHSEYFLYPVNEILIEDLFQYFEDTYYQPPWLESLIDNYYNI